MMTVYIVCIGKLKENYLRDGCEEYIKRLGSFCKIRIVELGEEKAADKASPKEIQTVIEKEGKRILEKIPKGAFTVAMCIEGKEISSQGFAKKLSDIALEGKSSLCVIIGGSFGLSDEVKSKADFHLSISPMTFPHQLARMMVLEQLYRAFSINANSKYHK